MGWAFQDYEGREIIMHTGGVNGFVTSVTLMPEEKLGIVVLTNTCLLYTSDAADERSSVDLGGRRIIKKKKYNK